MERREEQLEPFESLTAFSAFMQGWAEDAIKRVRGRNDISPRYVVVNALNVALVIVADDADLNDVLEKNELASLLYDVARAHDATRYAWMSAAWSLKPGTEEQADEARRWLDEHEGESLERAPYVAETVQISAGEWTGRVMQSTARIYRSRGRATLGAWETREDDWGPEGFSGRFVDQPMAAVTGQARLAEEEWGTFTKTVAEMESVRVFAEQYAREHGLALEELFALEDASPLLVAFREALIASPAMEQIDALAGEYGIRRRR